MLPARKPEVYAPARWPGRVWTAPNTFLGLIAGLGGRYAWRRADHVWEITGGWLIRLLERGGLADAITLGDAILYADRAVPPILREHEMVHVRQYRALGPFFLPAYLGESLFQWARTGDGYRHNRFEVAAYQNVKIK